MTIAVVGIGLIGGSLMVDLRKRGFAEKIIGVDKMYIIRILLCFADWLMRLTLLKMQLKKVIL